MSSAVISTSAALRRPFVFDAEPVPEVYSISDPQWLDAEGDSRTLANQSAISNQQSTIGNRKSAIGNSLTPASRLEIRPAPEMASSGISALDALTGGFPRGCLTEICGPASSGRTTVLLAALAASTRRGEYCVLIDASDVLDAHSLAAAGVELDRFLWVRCGDTSPQKSRAQEKSSQAAFKFAQTASRKDENRLEQLLRATDMLLESGGFGLIALDLCDLPLQVSRRIPLTTWFRYRRAVEHTPTVLLALEQHPIAGSCSSLLLRLGEPESKSGPGGAGFITPGRKSLVKAGRQSESRRGETNPDSHDPLQISYPAHTQLLTKLEIRADVERTRLKRKPSHSTSVTFASKTAWAG